MIHFPPGRIFICPQKEMGLGVVVTVERGSTSAPNAGGSLELEPVSATQILKAESEEMFGIFLYQGSGCLL